ncbi:MAG: NAD(P)/FAD-dependent oxidoreductase [Anaerolineae bacterium]
MPRNIAIVGGGLTGLSAADVLSAAGHAVTIYEEQPVPGGLAGSFEVNGTRLEKFYHHLFTSDETMIALVERLGLGERLDWQPSVTSYFVNRIYHLSTPLDLLRFNRVGLIDRLRLGMLTLRTRMIKDWLPLEEITAREWLVAMGGERVYQAVWEPLLRGKFGRHADEVAAVWMWNKLKLRGSSRGEKQEERLGYLRGGFGQVIEAWEALLRGRGVQFLLGTPAREVRIADGRVTGVAHDGGFTPYDEVLVTTAPAILTRLAPELPADYRQRLERIEYLANVCLVMQLDRSLSDTYWLNVGDPTIPFTGVIEHTNFQRPEGYGGARLAYLSRYLDPDDPYYAMDTEALLDAYEPHLARMFRGFERSWVQRAWAWRERYTQPVITRGYSRLKPPYRTPVEGLWLSCMAQVYPEDRGMNYAVASGQRVAAEMLAGE